MEFKIPQEILTQVIELAAKAKTLEAECKHAEAASCLRKIAELAEKSNAEPNVIMDFKILADHQQQVHDTGRHIPPPLPSTMEQDAVLMAQCEMLDYDATIH